MGRWCWKGFNLSHSSGLQSQRRNSANDFHGAKNHLAKIYEGEKKKNAARARGKPDYAAWNKTEGSFNARLKAVGSVKLWIPVICIAADCRLNNAQPPFPHFFQTPFFLCRFSFFSSSFFFSIHYYLIQLSVLRDTFFNQRRIVEQNCTPIKSKWTRGQFA